MSRAVSTVLDVGLCLLLLGAAVGVVLTASPPTATEDESTAVGTTLGTTTTAVTYETATGDDQTRRGTLAELLAAAAVANATIDDGPTIGNDQFVEATVNAVDRRRSLAAPRTDEPRRVQLRASWQPHENSSLRGAVVAGDSPPADADVRVTTVPIPVSTNRQNQFAGGNGSINQTNATATDNERAEAMAVATTALWFPQSATSPLAVNRTAPATVARLERAQELLVEPSQRVDPETEPATAHRRIEAGLVDHYRDVDDEQLWIETVELVVRTWTPGDAP